MKATSTDAYLGFETFRVFSGRVRGHLQTNLNEMIFILNGTS